MNWREFRCQAEGEKGFKGIKFPNPPTLMPLKPLMPEEGTSEVEGLATEAVLCQMIDDTYHGIDAVWRATPDRIAFTPEQRTRFHEIGSRIDAAYINLDDSALVIALREWWVLCVGNCKGTFSPPQGISPDAHVIRSISKPTSATNSSH